jgi:hypothetical protein
MFQDIYSFIRFHSLDLLFISSFVRIWREGIISNMVSNWVYMLNQIFENSMCVSFFFVPCFLIDGLHYVGLIISLKMLLSSIKYINNLKLYYIALLWIPRFSKMTLIVTDYSLHLINWKIHGRDISFMHCNLCNIILKF